SATVAYLAEKTSLTRKQIEGILDETLNLASKEAKKSGVFLLPGFGKLVLANRKARVQVPPREEPEGRGAWQEVGLEAARGIPDPLPFRFRLSLRRPFRGSGRVLDTGPCRTPRWPGRSSILPRFPGPQPTSPCRGAPPPPPTAVSGWSA